MTFQQISPFYLDLDPGSWIGIRISITEKRGIRSRKKVCRTETLVSAIVLCDDNPRIAVSECGLSSHNFLNVISKIVNSNLIRINIQMVRNCLFWCTDFSSADITSPGRLDPPVFEKRKANDVGFHVCIQA